MPIEDLPADVQPIARNPNRSPAEQETLDRAYQQRYPGEYDYSGKAGGNSQFERTRDVYQRKFGTAEIDPTVAPETTELDPFNAKKKAEWEAKHSNGGNAESQAGAAQPASAETTEAQPQHPDAEQGGYSPLWDTPIAESRAHYQQLYGDNYERGIQEDYRTIFVPFAEQCVREQGGTEEARAYVGKYLDDLMRRLGGHPLNARFLRFMAGRARYGKTV